MHRERIYNTVRLKNYRYVLRKDGRPVEERLRPVEMLMVQIPETANSIPELHTFDVLVKLQVHGTYQFMSQDASAVASGLCDLN